MRKVLSKIHVRKLLCEPIVISKVVVLLECIPPCQSFKTPCTHFRAQSSFLLEFSSWARRAWGSPVRPCWLMNAPKDRLLPAVGGVGTVGE